MTNHTTPRDRADAILLPYKLTDAQHAYAVEALIDLVKTKKIAWSKVSHTKHLTPIISDALIEAATADMEPEGEVTYISDQPGDDDFIVEEDDELATVHQLPDKKTRVIRAKETQQAHTRGDGTGPHAMCDHDNSKVARAKCRRHRARAAKKAAQG